MKSLLYTLIFTSLCFSLIAQKVTIKDDSENTLLEVNDEGARGSITLPSWFIHPLVTSNKLYNTNSQLYWNGTKLGTATEAGGLEVKWFKFISYELEHKSRNRNNDSAF